MISNVTSPTATIETSEPSSTRHLEENIPISIIIAISVGILVGIIILVLGFAYLYKKRCWKTEENRCQVVSSSRSRQSFTWISKRMSHRLRKSHQPFHPNPIKAVDLAEFVRKNSVIYQEFREAPKVRAQKEKVPKGCELKNRFANVFPIDESRVRLQRLNDDETTEYINANYIKGLNGLPNYYIASQAPLESTVEDFWRMMWEQESRVIIQLTKLIENGKSMCAEYLPSPEKLNNYVIYGNYQVVIEHRETKNKYAVSTIYLSKIDENIHRKITHYWYDWPELGVPSEQESILAMLLEARVALKTYAQDVEKELEEKLVGNKTDKEVFYQGPLIVHCFSGTGRTGTIIACDMAIQSIEANGSLDLPAILYHIRKGRARAVSTQEQYEFIYKVAYHYTLKFGNMYQVDIE